MFTELIFSFAHVKSMLNDIFRNSYDKKGFLYVEIYGLVVVVLCIVPAFLHAQEKDFTTWASAGLNIK